MPDIIRRSAARAVIIDDISNKIAIIEVKNGDFHKIPGGGIEAGETAEMAAIRESLEEGGCEVVIINRLGEHEFFDPKDKNNYHHSIGFLAKKIKDHPAPAFTQEEISKHYKLLWLTFEEAIKRFTDTKSTVPFELAMNNRDLDFIKIAQEYLKK
ncbi:MAG: NUDIX domain-containing protein [Candidatus Buchananbacteria bacterium]